MSRDLIEQLRLRLKALIFEVGLAQRALHRQRKHLREGTLGLRECDDQKLELDAVAAAATLSQASIEVYLQKLQSQVPNAEAFVGTRNHIPRAPLLLPVGLDFWRSEFALSSAAAEALVACSIQFDYNRAAFAAAGGQCVNLAPQLQIIMSYLEPVAVEAIRHMIKVRHSLALSFTLLRLSPV